MDVSFYQILFRLRDREVRQWAHEVIDMFAEPFQGEGVHPEDVHSAIDDPVEFMIEMEKGESGLRDAFMRYLSLVKERGDQYGDSISRRLNLLERPFVERLGFFDEREGGPHKFAGRDEGDSFEVPSPTDEELTKFYVRDVEEGAILVRRHIVALSGARLSRGLREYLDDLDQEFEEILKGVDESEELSTKRRIWEVEWMVGGALELLHMPKEGFRRQGGMIADGLEVALREVSADDMQKVSELVKTIRACLEADAIEGPPRDIAVEAHIVLSDILFSRERDEQEEDQSTNEASFREMTSAAYELIREGYPEVAVEAAGDMTENAPLAGAALLDAAFRHRLRDSSSSFLADIAPVLKRTRITAVAAKGSGAMHEFGEHLMAKKFPKAISEGAPVHLEFGGGLESYGLERADDRVADRWISIDPDVEAMRIYLETADELPKNFVPVTGRAEESAPFAANEPFAEDAVMVAPSRNGLDAMILSALLAVKPGGFVNVYMDAEIKNDLKWLEKTGFLVRDERISPGDPTLPPSGRLEGYSEVRHVRVAVGGLKGDGTDPTRSGRGDFDGAMRAMDASGPAAESGGGPKKSLGAVDEVSELDSWRRKHASVGPVSVMSLGLATWMGVLKAV